MTNTEALRRWRDEGDRKTGVMEGLWEGKRGKRVRSEAEFGRRAAPAATRDCERNTGTSSPRTHARLAPKTH